MARRRFFVDAVRDGRAVLTGESVEHLRRALRAQPGQRFEISDNQSAWLAEIEEFGRQRVLFRVLEPVPAEILPARLVLLASLIKFDRFEYMVEKATELGVESVLPVAAARSDKGLDRAAPRRAGRWKRIALESSQQARRTHVPRIGECAPFEQALRTPGERRYFLDEAQDVTPLLAALPPVEARSPSDVVCLLVGPEGGWTEKERAAAAGKGWTPVSLGPLVLRAETAALAALSILSNAWGLGRRP